MSGLIVDYYEGGGHETHSLGMHLSLDRIVAGLKAALPKLQGIYDKSAKVFESQAKPMQKTALFMVREDWSPPNVEGSFTSTWSKVKKPASSSINGRIERCKSCLLVSAC